MQNLSSKFPVLVIWELIFVFGILARWIFGSHLALRKQGQTVKKINMLRFRSHLHMLVLILITSGLVFRVLQQLYGVLNFVQDSSCHTELGTNLLKNISQMKEKIKNPPRRSTRGAFYKQNKILTSSHRWAIVENLHAAIGGHNQSKTSKKNFIEKKGQNWKKVKNVARRSTSHGSQKTIYVGYTSIS